MNDLERAFLTDIITHPADDTPRLIYADWLTDQGQEIRAEFIRRQIALARTGLTNCPTPKRARRLDVRLRCGSCQFCKAMIAAEEMSVECKDVADMKCVDYAYTLTDGNTKQTLRNVDYNRDSSVGDPFFHIWRGFVRVVYCTHSTWLQHGRTIAQFHPVEEVYLTDRRPAHSVENEHYWEDDEHFEQGESWGIPHRILSCLKDEVRRASRCPDYNSDQYLYPTREAAVKALSAACLEWARQPA